MAEQEHNRNFLAGVVMGALLGGCAAALMSMKNMPKEPEYATERGLTLKSHTEDVVQRAQQVANEAIARVQANSVTSQ